MKYRMCNPTWKIAGVSWTRQIRVIVPLWLLLFLSVARVPAAAITSPMNNNNAQIGVYYRYFITADNQPASFAADGLPSGISLNETTGEMSGTPTAAGSFAIQVSAIGTNGAVTASVPLTVYPEHPAVPTYILRLSDKVPAECPYGYAEFLPQSYNTGSTEMHPLIINLHALVRPLVRGDNKGNRLWDTGRAISGTLAMEQFEPRDCIALAPETEKWWNVTNLHAFLAYAFSHYRVDRSRVYLYGFSMGGGGTWEYVKVYGGEIAACVAVSGASNPKQAGDGAKFIGVPTWAFHMWDDKTVTRSNSIQWCNEIARAWSGNASDVLANYPGAGTEPGTNGMTATYDPGTGWRWFEGYTSRGDNNLRFTLWPTGGHGGGLLLAFFGQVPGGTKVTPQMWDWLFKQRKTMPAPDNAAQPRNKE
jgi:pimeloyl-ACP methyl ester carboxylesterase